MSEMLSVSHYSNCLGCHKRLKKVSPKQVRKWCSEECKNKYKNTKGRVKMKKGNLV